MKFLERWRVVWWGTHWSNSQTFSGSFIYSENIHIEYITAIGQISSKFEWNVPGSSEGKHEFISNYPEKVHQNLIVDYFKRSPIQDLILNK